MSEAGDSGGGRIRARTGTRARAGTRAQGADGLRANRDWRALWLGQAVSVVGDYVFDVTVVVWISAVVAKGQSWGPAAVGAVLVVAAVPVFTVGPLAGVYADRWDHRRTMLAADLVRVFLTLTLLAVPAAGDAMPLSVRLGFIYVVVALNATAAQFFGPARFALISRTVPPEDRARAAGLTQASSSVAAVIGPPLAAPLFFSLGVGWALAANAASFGVSFLAVRRVGRGGNSGAGADSGAGGAGSGADVPVPASVEPSSAEPSSAEPSSGAVRTGFFAEFRAGISAFAGNRTLVTLCLAAAVAMTGVGALNALDAFFVSDNLHADIKWLGFLNAAFGAGSVAGALLAGYAVRLIGGHRVFSLGLLITGVLMVAYSRTTALPWAIALLFLAGLPLTALNTVIGPLIMSITPKELLGRTISVINPAIQLASVLSMALASLLTSTVLLHFHGTLLGVHFGRIDTVFTVAALFVTAAGLFSLLTLRPPPD
ncbi:MFS transporter [Streptomyces sp. NBC_00448]|uniref:MFS transporter n=1 Tax=Streptomyces sp. NBC_00448 TaxID=2903652 RepID=UPI002E1BF0A2